MARHLKMERTNARESKLSPASQARKPLGNRNDSQQSRVSTAGTEATLTDTDDGSEATAPAQTIRDVSLAFRSGLPSPYHMAVVTLLGSLASGMPLASMFKVYTYIICEVYDPTIRDEPLNKNTASAAMKLPPAPELPNPSRCSLPWVQKSTSSYSAAMVTTGALLGLMTLSRASTMTRRFGRKPLLVIAHIVIALSILVFRLAVYLPPYAGAAVLFGAVVISEASAGAPLRIALQNYVVDTTSEAQRAGALSFIEGFGQVGAFPSSALGGIIASFTGHFFAPFYADCALMLIAIAYLLLIVPESKRNAEHTFVDNWLHSDDVEQDSPNGSRSAGPEEETQNVGSTDDVSEGASNATWSTTHAENDTSKLKWRSRLRAMNFLRPLAIFLPQRRQYAPMTAEDAVDAPIAHQTEPPDAHHNAKLSTAVHKIQTRFDFRLLNLAAVVVFEETYQAFMVPLLLLYNSERFGFDVLQNSSLISILQGTRALFLTAVFPPAVALARRYVAKVGLARRRKRVQKLKASARQRREASAEEAVAVKPSNKQNTAKTDERSPLLRGPSSTTKYGGVAARDYGSSSGAGPSEPQGAPVEARPARRRPSYQSAASLGYSHLASTRRVPGSSQFTISSSEWATHSIFASTPAELIKRIQRGKLDICVMLTSYVMALVSFLMLASTGKAPHAPLPSQNEPATLTAAQDGTWWKTPWTPLVISIVLLELSAGSTSIRTALIVNAVTEEDQTKALAAHQILVTVVAAVVPLLTSLVFGAALERGHPELVWLFKALFAALAALGALGLFWSHSGFYERAHDGNSDPDSDSDDDDTSDNEPDTDRAQI